MTKRELAFRIRELVQDHKSDRDGGYRLISAIMEFELRLEASDKVLFIEYMLDLVETHDAELWGIALEVLIRKGGPETGIRLERIVRSGKLDDESNGQIILALLRIGYPALDIYIPHIQTLLAQGKPACAELAHLYRVSPDLSLKMAAGFLAKEILSQGGMSRAESCLLVFIYNYPKEDESSLSKLIDETRTISANAAVRLRTIIADYLTKPWVIQYLGIEATERVVGHLGKEVTKR